MAARMMLSFAVAAALVAVAAPAEAGWRPSVHRHRHTSREQLADEARGMVRDGMPEPRFVQQRVDHFDALHDATYPQRYYVNDTFYNASLAAGVAHPPVFLYIDGEGAASPYDAVFGHHMEMAAVHGALVFAVEHRYYGASVPTATLSTEDLQYLSSQQALADLAAFRAHINEAYPGVTPNTTVIAFGGSYPGALAAWIRLKFPHVVYASVASSAPVLATFNFEGYNEVVASSLAREIVGGSAECLANVSAAFQVVDAMLGDELGRAKLSKLFNTCAPVPAPGNNDTAVFVAALSGAFQGSIQYNDEQPGAPSVRSMCAKMTTGHDPLAALAAVVAAQAGGECVDISYNNSMAAMRNTTVDRSAAGVGIRQWIYQSCTQFSYWQTCDRNTSCPFHTDTQSLASNLELCAELYNTSAAEVADRTAFTNDWYGGRDLQGSRILMVNGNVDPWHAISITNGVPGADVDSILIDGTAHCANMMSSHPDDPPALKAARAEIETKVAGWLQQAALERAFRSDPLFMGDQ